MVFSALSTFLMRVSRRLLIFFWSSRAQLITTLWNVWSTGTGGASVTHAAWRACRRFLPPSMSSSTFPAISSMMAMAFLKASSCWSFRIVSTEMLTVSVLPRSLEAVRESSSLSPEIKVEMMFICYPLEATNGRHAAREAYRHKRSSFPDRFLWTGSSQLSTLSPAPWQWLPREEPPPWERLTEIIS